MKAILQFASDNPFLFGFTLIVICETLIRIANELRGRGK